MTYQLIFATLRSDRVYGLQSDQLAEVDNSTGSEIVERFRNMFTTKTRPTWITLEPLSYQALSSLVSQTVHRPEEDCAPLSKFIFEASSGNAFSARSILTTLQRQHYVRNHSSLSTMREYIYHRSHSIGGTTTGCKFKFWLLSNRITPNMHLIVTICLLSTRV